MAAFELSIKAHSLADMETAIQELGQRFPVLVAKPPGAPDKPATGRRPGRPKSVVAAAPAEAAGEARALPDDVDAGGVGDPADGDAGAVEPEAAAEDQGAPGEAAPEAPGDAEGAQGPGEDMAGGAEAPAATAVAGPAGPEGAIAGAEAETAAPTIEDLKAAARDLAAKKGFDVCKKVFDDLGIAKPGKTPDDKIPAALAAVREALA